MKKVDWDAEMHERSVNEVLRDIYDDGHMPDAAMAFWDGETFETLSSFKQRGATPSKFWTDLWNEKEATPQRNA